MCMNAITSIIVMLGCSKVDIKILNVNIETIEINNCRKVSDDNKNTNSMLATI